MVREANAAIIEEAREGRPALEDIVESLGQVVALRELGKLGFHVGLQVFDERFAEFLADSLTLIGRLSIDAALDLEQSINALDHLQADWGDDDRLLALGLAAGS